MDLSFSGSFVSYDHSDMFGLNVNDLWVVSAEDDFYDLAKTSQPILQAADNVIICEALVSRDGETEWPNWPLSITYPSTESTSHLRYDNDLPSCSSSEGSSSEVAITFKSTQKLRRMKKPVSISPFDDRNKDYRLRPAPVALTILKDNNLPPLPLLPAIIESWNQARTQKVVDEVNQLFQELVVYSPGFSCPFPECQSISSCHTLTMLNIKKSTKDELKNHILIIHVRYKNLTCPHCPVTFCVKKQVDRHIKYAHKQ